MRHMPHQQGRPIVALKPAPYDGRGVGRLQSARHREDGVGVAGEPEQLGGLSRPELATVQHDIRSHATGRDRGGQARGRSPTRRRQRLCGIDVPPKGMTVVDQHDHARQFSLRIARWFEIQNTGEL